MAPLILAPQFKPATFLHAETTCNLCGSAGPFVTVATSDRYGLPTRTVECACGLQFINPRMTADGYAEFYAHHYRPLLSQLFKAPYTTRDVRQNQREYLPELRQALERWFVPEPGMTLLDLGGSTGLVARDFAQRYGVVPTVVDPCAAELAEAVGCDTVVGTAESVRFAPQSFDVILLCRTIEHLLDPAGVLIRARDWLKPGGCFVVDAMDVSQWPKGSRYKVDHPYSFTADTLTRMVRAAGWRVRGTWTRQRGWYTGLVCSLED